MKSVFSFETCYKLLDYIYPLFFIICFIEFYFGLWGISTAVKFLSILICFFFAMPILRSASKNSYNFHKFFSILFAYVIFSGIMYAFNGVPLKCYINELYNLIPAMFFVYVGMADKRNSRSFYDKFLIACTICMVIGLFLYVSAPQWYVNRRVEIVNNAWFNTTNYGENSVMQTLRFSSYLIDSYETDMYTMIALSIALFSYYAGIGKRGAIGIAFVLINFVAAILTQQRVAMAAASAMLLFYVVWGFFKKGSLKSSRLILVVIVSVSIAGVFIFTRYGDRVEQITELLNDRSENMSASSAFSERTNQFENVMKNWTMPIFGHGAGAGGAVAGAQGLPHVNDGGWVEFLYEYGIMGTLIFLLFITSTLKRGLKHMRYYLTELGIIAFVLVAMLGSNTLTLGYMIIFPFWYSIGRIWNKSNYEFITANEIKI